MSMRARTLKVLRDADFTAPQALALAQAIEGEIQGSQLVTTSVLDARFHSFELTMLNEFRLLRAEMNEGFRRCTAFTVTFGLTLAGMAVTALSFIILHFGK